MVRGGGCLALFVVLNNLFWMLDAAIKSPARILRRVFDLPTAVNGVWQRTWSGDLQVPETEKALLVVVNFPEQPGDMVYQAWVTRGTNVVSLGTVDVAPTGEGSLVF
ncbi:MAG: anti-sigma factor [Anaerolineaceae bacterium]|nr:anti-sigma factor [Anaerolineaceae bacterium]